MPRVSDEELLEAFLKDAPARIARLAGPGLAEAVPPAYWAAARSVQRQASPGWTAEVRDQEGFRMSGAMREVQFGAEFAGQCGQLVDTLLRARNPELKRAIASLGDEATAINGMMSAFFHYFVAHEFVHIEQGLGSEQYTDSDYYMPVVMEADYVADVSGLVLVLHASIPELSGLSRYHAMILLIAIHIASMHSFVPASEAGMDFYPFSRLALWYLHFARLCKADACPSFDSPSFFRSWIVTFPRLVGRTDQSLTKLGLDERAASPYPTAADVVVAYHNEDGLYRIHRAVLTDAQRVRRLCEAVLDGMFDAVREEYEELLVNNPALVPSADSKHLEEVEWAAGPVIDGLQQLKPLLAAKRMGVASTILATIRDDFANFISIVRARARPSSELTELIKNGEGALDSLAAVIAGDNDIPPSTLWSRALSVIDQIALAASE